MDRRNTAGGYRIGWNGLSSSGVKAPAGIYFCELKAGTETLVQKMIILSER